MCSEANIVCRSFTIIVTAILTVILRGCSCPQCPAYSLSLEEPVPYSAPSANMSASADADASPQTIEQLAKDDHIALFEMIIEHYNKNISDYTGTVQKHERLGGKLKEPQVIDFKFKERPYSLLMTWKRNPGAADKMLYVEGKHDGKMLVHPTGIMKWKRSVKKDPAGKEALEASLRPCYDFGFLKASERIMADYRLGKRNGDLKTAYLGQNLVDGRECILIERTLAQKDIYRYHKLVTAIDREYLVPVYLKATCANGDLYSEYSFSNLKFNVGLTDSDFTPKANDL